MNHETKSKGEELLDKALASCPADSTGRLAVLAVGYVLIDVKIELAHIRSLLGDRRFASTKPSDFGADPNLPPGVKKLSTCKACKASIYWLQTRNAKRMPVDSEPNPEGKLGISPQGIVGGGFAGPKYTSHFATCPEADEQRKDRT